MSPQFELLSALAQEIQEMKVQLGQLMADCAEKQELAGSLVSVWAPCRICHCHGSDQRVQDEDFEKSTSSDTESQLL